MIKKISFALFVSVLVLGGWWYWQRRQQLPIAVEALSGMHTVVPVAIIGSGPAGLGAALYTVRLGYHTVIFEGPKPGGQLTETTMVENWPGVGKALGADLMKRERAYVAGLGAILVSDTVTALDLKTWPFMIQTDSGQEIRALSVIVATGSAPRVLEVAGERQYWGKGVTTCALCDAPYYQGKQVVIVGGGDSALEEATQLAPYARQITVLVRKADVRASAALRARVQELAHVSIAFNQLVTQIMGDEHWVTGVRVRDMRTKQERVLPIDGVFLAIGHEPRTALVAGQLACDRAGTIVVYGRGQATSVRGVFAAGEVADAQYRQAGVAAADGIKAAIDASRFLTEIGWSDKRARELNVTFFTPKRVAKNVLHTVSSLKEFDQLIATPSQPIVVDFYAPYCPSCMHMLPAFEAVADQFVQDALFVKVDVSVLPEIEQSLKIERIPCFIVFKNKQPVARYYAIMDKTQMVDMVRRTL